MNPSRPGSSSRPEGPSDLAAAYAQLNRRFQIVSILAAAIIAVGVVFYRFVEGFTWVDAFYFSIVTLGTVGYGDIVPTTDGGKIFTSFYILIGIGIIAAFASALMKRAVIRREYRSQQRKQ